ncbi:flagellar basal body P-ring formation chaperone FlgA [Caulobacter sp. 17J80-11]|uniref:flagellar basal body P-ring formation chaperone FlgA n=1 Tax=Caulobacter sp. 17J80-11 TaxID=2763502 RepID=UPI00210467C0|nr:flagellar basal body P-ring formation chaperone FlgA [Caulobacter sp. 17J80-11]
MRKLSALLVCAAALAVAGQACAGAPVSLRGDLADADGAVTLGDLFEGAGRVSNVVVARGPQAGSSVVLDAAGVQRLARANGLDWANAEGFQRLVVRSGAPAGGAVVTAAAAGPSAATVEVLTYSRSLAAGETVRPEDVVWTKVQAHLAPADAPRDAETVIGQSAKRPVRAGAPVANRDLAAALVIHKGELVSVAYSVGGVNLVLQGSALQNASAGETFSVLNPQSKKTIEAVATGPGRAVVGPEADSLKASRFALR